MAVYALGFFGGPTASQVLRDRIRADEDRFTRYNAAVARGRHGDPAAEATLREMLSTADLDRVVEIESPTEKQNKIEAIQLEALEALRTSLHTSRPELTQSLRPEVEKLTKSGLISVRNKALEVLRGVASGSGVASGK